MTVTSKELDQIFADTRMQYPEEFHWIFDQNNTRIRWQVEMVLKNIPAGGRLLDIGAGVVPFMLICQKLGYETIVIDDMEDATYQTESSKQILDVFKDTGVQLINGDAFEIGLDALSGEKLDLVTSHDSMEHWHNSPKKLFHELWKELNKGGLFWIGVPNCVNLRKRITVPFGKGKWSQMKDWYEPEIFRGHVREPDVDDLRYIGRDLGAARVEIVGKNWLGYRNPSRLIRTITPVVDRGMQFFPSLCSDIYLFAWK
ncbi:MAG TPA: methyltransferase domain-containing protein [Rhodobacteraceae bacterium]|nr:methyltransferase domain-containing protein [Paracoccaceae bacterium]